MIASTLLRHLLALGFFVTNTNTVFSSPLSAYEVLFSWKSIEYKFPSAQTRSKLLETREFIPENNILTGIKVHGSRIYLTVSRFYPGVPSTLNYIHLNSVISSSRDRSPLLIPYPSWRMQKIGNCNALQFVQSMEIDRLGRMWVIDVGRGSILSPEQNRSRANCPPKLLLIDLATNVILHKHEFPANVVNPSTNFINDIVVECKSEYQWACWAYMTDTLDSKLVIYSLEQDKSWSVQNIASMKANPQASRLTILGTNYNFNFNINGIALSPLKMSNHDRLYYTPVASFSIYSVLTSTLKQAFATGKTHLSDSEVERHASNRSSQSGGMVIDSSGLLFTGQLQNNAVSYYNTTDTINTSGGHIFKKETLVIQNDVDLQWPDTFSFDTHGCLYVTTVKLHRFMAGTLDFGDVNFRVVRVYVGSRSYMY